MQITLQNSNIIPLGPESYTSDGQYLNQISANTLHLKWVNFINMTGKQFLIVFCWNAWHAKSVIWWSSACNSSQRLLHDTRATSVKIWSVIKYVLICRPKLQTFPWNQKVFASIGFFFVNAYYCNIYSSLMSMLYHDKYYIYSLRVSFYL